VAGDRLSAGRPPLIIKRKYLEVIIRAKLDAVTTVHDDATVERPRNASGASRPRCIRSRSSKISNPKGAAWAQEMIATEYV
jgi:hypothetical protein